MSIFTIVSRSLLARKTRSVLTALGIAVGIGTMVSLLGFTEGYREITSAFSDLLKSDLLIVDRRIADLNPRLLEESTEKDLAGIPGVTSIQKMLVGILGLEDLPGVVVYATDPPEMILNFFRVHEGTFFSDAGRQEILVGRATAKSLHKEVGDYLDVAGELHRVVGIYSSPFYVMDATVVLPLRQLQRATGRPGRVMAFGVGLERGASVSDAQKLIERKHPQLQCMGLAESIRKNDLLRIAEAFIWAISMVALTVGGIGAFNTMNMSVFERTKEIGILRSFGWPGPRVFLIVMTEGLILGVLGGVLGCVVGMGLDLLVEAAAHARGMIVSVFTWQLCLKALIAAALLGSCGGLFPAWKATRISPVTALRGE